MLWNIKERACFPKLHATWTWRTGAKAAVQQPDKPSEVGTHDRPLPQYQ